MLSKLVIRQNRAGLEAPEEPGGNASLPVYPAYTNYPTVNYADLWAAAPSTITMADGTVLPKGPLAGPGSNVNIVLKSLSYRAYVVLPAKSGGVSWEGEIIGNHDVNQMGVYVPNVMGIWCHPSDVPTVTFGSAGQIQISGGPTIRQKEGSCTGSQSTTGTNGGNALPTMLRIGPYGGAETGAVHVYGVSFEGTDQDIDPSTGILRATSGPIDYYSTNSTWDIVKYYGFVATWNAPPGETFQMNSFRCNGCTYRFIETDGFNREGVRRGGGFGFFATDDITFEDCYFHDALNGGWTGGASGNVETGTASVNMTARRVYSWNNANYEQGSAHGFSCFNSEGVIGTALFDHCNFKYTWPKTGGTTATTYNAHIGFYSLIDDAQVTLIEPEWNPGTYGSAINNAFGFDMPAAYAWGVNKQVTIPTVIKNGVTLQPVRRVGGATYNPATQFMYNQ